MNETTNIIIFICLGVGIVINYYNINKHLKEHKLK